MYISEFKCWAARHGTLVIKSKNVEHQNVRTNDLCVKFGDWKHELK